MDTQDIVIDLENLFTNNSKIYNEIARRMGAPAIPINIYRNESYHLRRRFKRKISADLVQDDGTVELLSGTELASNLVAVRGFTIGVLGFSYQLLVYEHISGVALLGPVIPN